MLIRICGNNLPGYRYKKEHLKVPLFYLLLQVFKNLIAEKFSKGYAKPVTDNFYCIYLRAFALAP